MEKYKVIDDLTSDVLFEAYGNDLKELFENSAAALSSVVCDIEKVEKQKSFSVELKGESVEDLMINWLQEIIALVDTEEILRHGRELIKDNDSGSSVGVSSTEAQQQTDNRLDCLREHVVISRAEVVNADWGRQLELDIRNNLSWPMAGLWFSYSVRSPERSVPWDDGDFPISIAGGIEPGETRTIRTSIILPREAEMPLEVIASILDAADQDKRLFINERGVMGWPDEQSVMGCE